MAEAVLPDVATLSFETALKQLEEIVTRHSRSLPAGVRSDEGGTISFER